MIALDGAVISEGVKTIGERSFSRLRDAGELVIPNGVEIIEDRAFSTCDYTNIVFPDTLLEIGDHIFRQCRNLKKLIFPKNLKRIGEDSFTLSSLEEVIIHADTEIGKGSFESITKWTLDPSDNTFKGGRQNTFRTIPRILANEYGHVGKQREIAVLTPVCPDF